MEIIGEAAKSVSAETRATLPQIPRRAIAGTRDRLVHAYLDQAAGIEAARARMRKI